MGIQKYGQGIFSHMEICFDRLNFLTTLVETTTAINLNRALRRGITRRLHPITGSS